MRDSLAAVLCVLAFCFAELVEADEFQKNESGKLLPALLKAGERLKAAENHTSRGEASEQHLLKAEQNTATLREELAEKQLAMARHKEGVLEGHVKDLSRMVHKSSSRAAEVEKEMLKARDEAARWESTQEHEIAAAESRLQKLHGELEEESASTSRETRLLEEERSRREKVSGKEQKIEKRLRDEITHGEASIAEERERIGKEESMEEHKLGDMRVAEEKLTNEYAHQEATVLHMKQELQREKAKERHAVATVEQERIQLAKESRELKQEVERHEHAAQVANAEEARLKKEVESANEDWITERKKVAHEEKKLESQRNNALRQEKALSRQLQHENAAITADRSGLKKMQEQMEKGRKKVGHYLKEDKQKVVLLEKRLREENVDVLRMSKQMKRGRHEVKEMEHKKADLSKKLHGLEAKLQLKSKELQTMESDLVMKKKQGHEEEERVVNNFNKKKAEVHALTEKLAVEQSRIARLTAQTQHLGSAVLKLKNHIRNATTQYKHETEKVRHLKDELADDNKKAMVKEALLTSSLRNAQDELKQAKSREEVEKAQTAKSLTMKERLIAHALRELHREEEKEKAEEAEMKNTERRIQQQSRINIEEKHKLNQERSALKKEFQEDKLEAVQAAERLMHLEKENEKTLRDEKKREIVAEKREHLQNTKKIEQEKEREHDLIVNLKKQEAEYTLEISLDEAKEKRNADLLRSAKAHERAVRMQENKEGSAVAKEIKGQRHMLKYYEAEVARLKHKLHQVKQELSHKIHGEHLKEKGYKVRLEDLREKQAHIVQKDKQMKEQWARRHTQDTHRLKVLQLRTKYLAIRLKMLIALGEKKLERMKAVWEKKLAKAQAAVNAAKKRLMQQKNMKKITKDVYNEEKKHLDWERRRLAKLKHWLTKKEDKNAHLVVELKHLKVKEKHELKLDNEAHAMETSAIRNEKRKERQELKQENDLKAVLMKKIRIAKAEVLRDEEELRRVKAAEIRNEAVETKKAKREQAARDLAKERGEEERMQRLETAKRQAVSRRFHQQIAHIQERLLQKQKELQHLQETISKQKAQHHEALERALRVAQREQKSYHDKIEKAQETLKEEKTNNRKLQKSMEKERVKLRLLLAAEEGDVKKYYAALKVWREKIHHAVEQKGGMQAEFRNQRAHLLEREKKAKKQLKEILIDLKNTKAKLLQGGKVGRSLEFRIKKATAKLKKKLKEERQWRVQFNNVYRSKKVKFMKGEARQRRLKVALRQKLQELQQTLQRESKDAKHYHKEVEKWKTELSAYHKKAMNLRRILMQLESNGIKQRRKMKLQEAQDALLLKRQKAHSESVLSLLTRNEKAKKKRLQRMLIRYQTEAQLEEQHKKRESQLLQQLHNERKRFEKGLEQEKRAEHKAEQIEQRKLQNLRRILNQVQAQGRRELELEKTKGMRKLNAEKKKEADMLSAAKRRTAYLRRQIALEKALAAQRMKQEGVSARLDFQKASASYARKIKMEEERVHHLETKLDLRRRRSGLAIDALKQKFARKLEADHLRDASDLLHLNKLRRMLTRKKAEAARDRASQKKWRQTVERALILRKHKLEREIADAEMHTKLLKAAIIHQRKVRNLLLEGSRKAYENKHTRQRARAKAALRPKEKQEGILREEIRLLKKRVRQLVHHLKVEGTQKLRQAMTDEAAKLHAYTNMKKSLLQKLGMEKAALAKQAHVFKLEEETLKQNIRAQKRLYAAKQADEEHKIAFLEQEAKNKKHHLMYLRKHIIRLHGLISQQKSIAHHFRELVRKKKSHVHHVMMNIKSQKHRISILLLKKKQLGEKLAKTLAIVHKYKKKNKLNLKKYSKMINVDSADIVRSKRLIGAAEARENLVKKETEKAQKTEKHIEGERVKFEHHEREVEKIVGRENAKVKHLLASLRKQQKNRHKWVRKIEEERRILGSYKSKARELNERRLHVEYRRRRAERKLRHDKEKLRHASKELHDLTLSEAVDGKRLEKHHRRNLLEMSRLEKEEKGDVEKIAKSKEALLHARKKYAAFEINLKKKNKKWEHDRNLLSKHWQVRRRRVLAERRRLLGIIKTENAKYARESRVVKGLILKVQKALQRKERAMQALKNLMAVKELNTDVVGLQKFKEKLQNEQDDLQSSQSSISDLAPDVEYQEDQVKQLKSRLKQQIEKANQTAGLQKKAMIKSKMALLSGRSALLQEKQKEKELRNKIKAAQVALSKEHHSLMPMELDELTDDDSSE